MIDTQPPQTENIPEPVAVPPKRNILPLILGTFIIAFGMGMGTLYIYNQSQPKSVCCGKPSPISETVPSTNAPTMLPPDATITPTPASAQDTSGKTFHEFKLKNYNGNEYTLAWKELTIPEEKDTPDNKDALSNAKEPVSLVETNTTGKSMVINTKVFELSSARFELPCMESPDNYFPETAKHYKEVCNKLTNSEIFVTRAHGWTDGRDEFIINLQTGLAKNTGEINQ